MMMTVAPSRPRPTVNMPATPPVRNATLSAPGSEPVRAAAAVRTLPRTARLMPMKPVRPDMNAPGDERERAEQAGLGEREAEASRRALASGFSDLGRGDEHDDRERDQDHRDRLELPPQVGHRAFLDGRGDLDHLRRALVGGEHAPHEAEADRDRRAAR